MLEFQAISWCAKNDAQYKSRVHVFGRTAAGHSVHLEVPFSPWLYVRTSMPHYQLVDNIKRRLGYGGRGLVEAGCRQVQATDFVGFKAGRKDAFSRIEVDSIWAFRNVKNMVTEQKWGQTFEGNVDPVLKLLHLRDLPPCGWICADVRARGDVHETVLPSALRRAPEDPGRPIMAPFVIVSYDIETYSATGDFPQASNEDDAVIQICLTFHTIGDPPGDTEAVLLCLGDCSPVADAEVECFDDELEMLKRWAELLQDR